MANTLASLPAEQQQAIRDVLSKAGLTETGEVSIDKLSDSHKAALKAAFGENEAIAPFGINFKCIAARVAEGAAVAACASVPGGQIAIAACIAVAHEAANAACN